MEPAYHRLAFAGYRALLRQFADMRPARGTEAQVDGMPGEAEPEPEDAAGPETYHE